jgi:hypothetical protein
MATSRSYQAAMSLNQEATSLNPPQIPQAGCYISAEAPWLNSRELMFAGSRRIEALIEALSRKKHFNYASLGRIVIRL